LVLAPITGELRSKLVGASGHYKAIIKSERVTVPNCHVVSGSDDPHFLSALTKKNHVAAFSKLAMCDNMATTICPNPTVLAGVDVEERVIAVDWFQLLKIVRW
jgi:hypothetical protein